MIVRSADSKSKHVLIVEDDPTFRSYLIGVLDRIQDMEFRVTDVPTVQAARDAMAVRSFDLVLLDLKLPNGAGIETLRKLQRSVPPPYVPVIVCTGDASEEEREECYRAGGVQEYVPKEALGSLEAPAIMRRVIRAALARDEGFGRLLLAASQIFRRGETEHG